MRSSEARRGVRERKLGNISSHARKDGRDSAGLKNSDPPRTNISRFGRSSTFYTPPRCSVPRDDGEKMIYDRGCIQNPISLLVNDRLPCAVLTVIPSNIGKSVAVSVICLATWLIRETNSVIVIEWELSGNKNRKHRNNFELVVKPLTNLKRSLWK